MDTIGFVGPMEPWLNGGIAVHTEALSRHLALRYRIEAVTPTWGDYDGAARLFQSSCFTNRTVHAIRRFPPSPMAWSEILPEMLGALRYLRRADILHVHDARVCGVNRILNRPMVTTFHGYLTLESVANGLRPHTLRFDLLENQLLHALHDSDALIAVDQRIARWLESYGADRVHVIPNGVDTERFHPGLPSPPPDHPIILCARGFVAKNGVEVAIRAMRLILDEVPNATLVLAGRGPLEDKLKDLVRSRMLHTRVLFPGMIPHERMPKAIAAASFVLLPSVPIAGVEEATSCFALEAMASGKPVIASDIGGLSEILEDKETGLLVPPNDPEAIAAQALDLLSMPSWREEIGRNARDYVIRNHSWSSVADKTAAVYEEVLP